MVLHSESKEPFLGEGMLKTWWNELSCPIPLEASSF